MTIQAKIIAALILTILLTVVTVWGGQTILEWKKGAEQNVQRGQTLETATAITKDGTKADQQKVQVELDVTGAREGFRQAIEEAKKHEPDTVTRGNRNVPPSVRDAYRQRRLERERSGRNGGQREEAPAPESAPER